MSRLTRVASGVLVVGMMIGASCTSESDPSSSSSAAAVVETADAPGPTPPSTPATTAEPPTTTAATSTSTTAATTTSTTAPLAPEAEELAAALDELGLVVVDSGVDAASGSLPVLRHSIPGLQRELDSGGGVLGSSIDTVAPMPAGFPAMSFVIAGWVTAGDTARSRWAEAAMGSTIWVDAPSIVFPAVVVELFMADVLDAVDAPSSGVSAASGRVVSRGGRVASCFVDVLAEVKLGLLFQTAAWLVKGGAIPPPVGAWIMTGGQLQLVDVTLLQLLLEAEWATQRMLVGQALARLSALGIVASGLSGWTASVSASAPADRFAVGDEPDRPQAFTAEYQPPFPVWPPLIEGCAEVHGIPLPAVSGAGATATWSVTGLPELGAEVSRDDVFDDEGEARFSWTTGREATADGEPILGTVEATVLVDVAARAALLSLWEAALTSAFAAAGPLLPALQLQMSDVTESLSTVMNAAVPPSATVAVEVTRHEQCSETLALRDGVWTGPLSLDVTGVLLGAAGSVDTTGSGEMTVEVVDGAIAGGTWSLQTSSSGTTVSGAFVTTVENAVMTASGGVTGTPAEPVVEGTVQFSGVFHVEGMEQSFDIPVDFAGPARESLTWTTVDCDTASGTFVPSFTDANGDAYFFGTATWTATRQPPA